MNALRDKVVFISAVSLGTGREVALRCVRGGAKLAAPEKPLQSD